MDALSAVILAAGKGTRMKSDTPKVLHPLSGIPMIRYPAALARALKADPIVIVVGHEGEAVRAEFEDSEDSRDIRFVRQEPQLGTGHAVGFAKEILDGTKGDVLILCGDVPLLLEPTLRGLVDRHRESRAVLTVLTGRMEDAGAYGRIVRNEAGDVLRIVEAKDAAPEQLCIQEMNSGTYCARSEYLFRGLEALGNSNAQSEYYLTDLVEILSGEGVSSYEAPSTEEFLGINDREQLAQADGILQRRLRSYWMKEGVTLQDPNTVYLDAGVRIERDTVIEPHVMLKGETVIESGCRIGTGTVIEDSVLERDVLVRPYCAIYQSRIARGSSVGPFAHLRPETVVLEEARIGNFVEIKKSKIGKGSKVPHLSYVGDSEIGERVNIGAGTITCNYDGVTKHPTFIEDDVFVGSDTQFVAPVRIGKGAIVGAGSTITKDVPPETLAVSRARQVNLKGKAARRKPKK